MSVGGALPQRALLQQLAGAGVDFVLVGGLAVARAPTAPGSAAWRCWCARTGTS